MSQLMYGDDPPVIKGLFCVYMAGSVECALRQHPECMNAEDCLFHRTDPGCGIEQHYRELSYSATPMLCNVYCRSDQARILVRTLAEQKGDFPEMIFGLPPGNNPDSFWVSFTEDQKAFLRKSYREAYECLYGEKRSGTSDPGHEEGSRTAVVVCTVDDTDNSPNRNSDIIPADYMKDFMELDPDERKRRLHGLPAKSERPDSERGGMSADVITLDGRVVYSGPIALNPDREYVIVGGKMPEVPEHFKEKGSGTVSDAEVCLPGLPVRDDTEQHNALSEHARVEAVTRNPVAGSLLGMAVGGMLGAVSGISQSAVSPGQLSGKFRERLVEGTYERGITQYLCERESSKAWKRRMKKERQRIVHRDRAYRELLHRFKRLMEDESMPGFKGMFGTYDPILPGNSNKPVGIAFTSRYGILDDLDRTTGRLWMSFIKSILLSE